MSRVRSELLLQTIRDNPGMTNDQLGTMLGHTASGLNYHLSKLKRQGMITYEGSITASDKTWHAVSIDAESEDTATENTVLDACIWLDGTVTLTRDGSSFVIDQADAGRIADLIYGWREFHRKPPSSPPEQSTQP